MRQIRPLTPIIYLLALLLLVTSACGAQVSDGTISGAKMAAANQLYETGRFAEAAVAYQGLVDAGAHDGRLYYNLGNAFFKAGDLGRAVLNFRRAQRLFPWDADVTANLEFARDQAVDRFEVENEGAIVDLVRRLVGWTTLNEAAISALIVWVALCGLGTGAVLWRKKQRLLLYVAGIFALLLLLGLLSIGIKVLDEQGKPPAVIVAEEVALHSGPGEDYLTEFTLHAGAEVRVLDRRGDWIRVALPGALQGWAPGHAVIELLPTH